MRRKITHEENGGIMIILRLILIPFILLAGCFLFVTNALPDEKAQNESLGKLIAEALENNLQITAVYNEWKAAEYKISSERSLPDPEARYSRFGEEVQTRVGPQENKYGASVKVPFPAKLIYRGKAQSARADMLGEKYESIKREVIRNVKFIYYDIFWVDKAIQVTEEEKSILESLEKVARRRYESNLSPQQDVVKIQVELSKLVDKLLILSKNRKSLESKLNVLLNRREKTLVAKVSGVEPAIFKYSIEELRKMSKDKNQDLLAAGIDIEKAEYEKTLARMEYFPDFNFGFDYIQVGSGYTMSPDDGQDAWMATVSITLPIWFGKNNARINEKESLLEASKNKFESAKSRVVNEIEDFYYKIRTNREIVTLYKTALIPQTQQSFETSKAAYESGKADFLDWLDSERVLLQTRLAYYKSIVDYMKAIAYLERIVGEDL